MSAAAQAFGAKDYVESMEQLGYIVTAILSADNRHGWCWCCPTGLRVTPELIACNEWLRTDGAEDAVFRYLIDSGRVEMHPGQLPN